MFFETDSSPCSFSFYPIPVEKRAQQFLKRETILFSSMHLLKRVDVRHPCNQATYAKAPIMKLVPQTRRYVTDYADTGNDSRLIDTKKLAYSPSSEEHITRDYAITSISLTWPTK
jgi:hypothetical protein